MNINGHKVSYLESEDQVAMYIDGLSVGGIVKQDYGYGDAGKQRVVWSGSLDLAGFDRTFKPRGKKSSVYPEIKRRVRAWAIAN